MRAVDLTWPRALYDHFQLPDWHVEVKLNKRAVRADTAFENLKSYLPTKVYQILDIGSGLAMLIPLIVDHCKVEVVHLLDGDGTAKQTASYRLDAKAWSNVTLGQAIVKANTPENVQVWSYTPSYLEKLSSYAYDQIDLITSFRAWGHHFPIDVYMKLVNMWLTKDGTIITDIRNGTNGKEALTHYGFQVVDRIPDHSTKCERLVFKRTSK